MVITLSIFKAYRCEVCGETYLGESKPKNCPYCGAHEEYINELEEYDRLMPEEVSKESRENVLAAIELEIDNAKFYACAAKKTENEKEAAIFKRLGKIEAEHAEALAEVIDVPEEEIPTYEECSNKAQQNYKEAHRREDRAITKYTQFAQEAETQELEELFNAIVEIEKDHLELSERKTN